MLASLTTSEIPTDVGLPAVRMADLALQTLDAWVGAR